MPRLPFTAEHLQQLNELWEEGIEEITENLGDKRFQDNAPRKLIIEAEFLPETDDPTLMRVLLSKKIKVPPRKSKSIKAVIRQGQMLLDEVMEDQSLFPDEEKVRSIRREGGD